VVGCNRVGTAGDGTEHVGDTRIISPMGELLATAAGIETIVLADVDAAEVAATRDRLRFLPDRRG
jgi:predicted amidohydrolase